MSDQLKVLQGLVSMVEARLELELVLDDQVYSYGAIYHCQATLALLCSECGQVSYRPAIRQKATRMDPLARAQAQARVSGPQQEVLALVRVMELGLVHCPRRL